MSKHTLFAFAVLAFFGVIVPAPSASSRNEGVTAQTDLDAFMERVLARRDENWKKLQQYVLDEKESFDLLGPGGFQLWGMRREYTWFVKQGIFVRSPVRANGVAISEEDRRKAEAAYIRRVNAQEERAKRRAEREAKGLPPERDAKSVTITTTGDIKVSSSDDQAAANPAVPSNMEDVLRQGVEPQFVSAAYFLKFKFESGRYALVGREKINDREALKIEYYPTRLFKEGRTRPSREVREREAEIEDKMNKASLVTLWVDRNTHQILQYTFDDLDMDFFPGRALVRVSDLKATMQMSQPFPEVWLPSSIEMRFGMMLAVGAVDATYHVEYINYKQADVTYRIK